MVFDFHTHSFLSDGVLSPVEVIRIAMTNGYRAVAITDHVGPGNCIPVLEHVIRECEFCSRYWDILAVPGVEITHVPAGGIAEVARLAKANGARIVVVHGETVVEPVEAGTNLAAVSCPDVDVLAHPGFLTIEEARLAAANNIFIEISARKGHCLTNGHVAKVGREAGAMLLVNSDAHEPRDFLSAMFVDQVARGTGFEGPEVTAMINENPLLLLRKLGYSLDENR